MARKRETVLRDLGLRLRELRGERGLTQEAAAEKLGMLAPNYAKIEQGRLNVTVGTLVRLANVFNVGVGDLFVSPTNRNVRVGRPRKAE